MILIPCKYCGYDDNTEIKNPETKQFYCSMGCQKCGAQGPRGKNQLEACKGWNANGDYVPVPVDPSKCSECGWNGEDSEVKEFRQNDKTMHWLCPQCNAPRVTMAGPKLISKRWKVLVECGTN